MATPAKTWKPLWQETLNACCLIHSSLRVFLKNFWQAELRLLLGIIEVVLKDPNLLFYPKSPPSRRALYTSFISKSPLGYKNTVTHVPTFLQLSTWHQLHTVRRVSWCEAEILTAMGTFLIIRASYCFPSKGISFYVTWYKKNTTGTWSKIFRNLEAMSRPVSLCYWRELNQCYETYSVTESARELYRATATCRRS
jgi:hypothetical protein